MSAPGLPVALRYLDDAAVETHGDANHSLGAVRGTAEDLAGLEGRVNRLIAETGASASADSTAPASRQSNTVSLSSRSWDELVEEATARLEANGVDTSTLDLDSLLDPAEVERLNRRHEGGFTLTADLDQFDIIAAVAAGLTACIIDALVVRIPADTKWFGGGQTVKGSPLTKALRNLSIDSDNWLAQWAKVSYDRVSGLSEPVEGLFPKSHRVQTFGHDPLLGLVMGTADIMRGTMTAVSRGGSIVVNDTADPVRNPFMALATQILHLLSDVPTASGLPLPGWSALSAVEIGAFGPNLESVGGVARRMYLNGYDSWHFLTMSTSVCALELVLRGYWGVRGVVDEEWRRDNDVQRQVSRATATSDHPRFAAMSLAANGIAAAGNLGKLGVYGGNPLALNYVQWLSFTRSFFKWAELRMVSPSRVVERHARVNAMAIESGWEGLDFSDPAFPELSPR